MGWGPFFIELLLYFPPIRKGPGVVLGAMDIPAFFSEAL